MPNPTPKAAIALKGAAVALSAVALAWVSTGVTLNFTLDKTNPELALKWWPWGAQAKAALATKLVSKEEPASGELARAEQLSREVLAREPVNVDAVRSLAIVRAHQGKDAEADRLFAYSEKLSRRDLPTQIWMIEKAVREENVPLALTHYDRALRTSRQAPDLLLPTLVSAAEDPAISVPLARVLASRPAWWQDFMSVATRDIKNPKQLLTFADVLKLTLKDPYESVIAHNLVDRLVASGEKPAAYGYYAQLTGIPAASIAGIRDGDFNSDPGQFVFDWRFSDQPGFSASREMFDGNDWRLVLRASSGQGGDLASQMLLLKPGSYTLSGRAGATGSNRLERPTIAIRCDEKTVLVQELLPEAGPDGAAFALPFTVPEGCASQTLAVQMVSSEAIEPWIDGLAIK